MKRTIRGSAVVAPALLLLTALAATPAPGLAQEMETRTECRCVDRDGNEVENCTCLRTPDTRGLMARVFGPEGRPRVGITLDPRQSPEVDARGARIAELIDDGPADEAGLREGDVVVRFDGHDLLVSLGPEMEEDFDLDQSLPVQRLLTLARRLEPGDEVEVVYLRDGERRTTTVEARELERWGARAWTLPAVGEPGGRFEVRIPEGRELRLRGPEARRFELRRAPGGPDGGVVVVGDGRFDRCPPEGDGREGPSAWGFGDACPGGLRLVALNPGLAEYFGTDRGALVADVHPDSPLGLRPGDVIHGIGAREVDSPDRVRSILRSYEEGEPITFHIVREGREMDVQGRLSP